MSSTTDQEPTPNQPADVKQILSKAAAGHLESGRIADLSDPTRQQLRAFVSIWPTLPTETRRYLVREMARQAQENLALDFRRLLHQALEDDDSEVRALAIQSLWEEHSSSFLRALCELGRHEQDAAVQEAIAISLGRFAFMAEVNELDQEEAERTRSALLHLLEHGRTWMVKRRALESAGYMTEDPEINCEILDTYQSEFEQERAGALVAMGHSLDNRWYGTVMRELANEDPDIRCEAVRAAGQFGNPDAIDALGKMIDDEDDEIRHVAIHSIGQIGGDKAVEMLRYLEKQADEDLKSEIDSALEEAKFLAEPTGMGDR